MGGDSQNLDSKCAYGRHVCFELAPHACDIACAFKSARPIEFARLRTVFMAKHNSFLKAFADAP
jgi:hypothetical protein